MLWEATTVRVSGHGIRARIVVVLTPDEECVITVYRSGPEPYRYVPDTRIYLKSSGPKFRLGDVVDSQTDDDGSSSEDE